MAHDSHYFGRHLNYLPNHHKGKKDILLTELENPVCGDNDIVVRNIYADICRTDVAVYMHGPNTGHRVTVGGEFGHEMVSEVAEVGKT